VEQKEIETFRKSLIELRRRLTSSVSRMQNDAFDKDGRGGKELSDIPLEHLADRASDTFNSDLLIEIIENNEAEIIDIDRALDEIDEGTYGKCERCDARISTERLKALPFARVCIECKRREDGG